MSLGTLLKKIGIQVDTNADKAASKTDKLSQSMDKAAASSKHMADANKRSQERLAALGKDVRAIGAGLGAFAATLGVGAAALDKASSRALQFQAVSQNLAFSIDGARKATLGLVDDMTLMTQANQAARLGVAKNGKEFAELAEIATKLGLSVGQDATKSVEDLTLALGRSSPMILDNLGIQLKLSEAHRIYADKLGKTVSELTDAEKKQAFLNAALDKGREAIKGVNLELSSGAKSIQQYKAELSSTLDDVLLKTFKTIDDFGKAQFARNRKLGDSVARAYHKGQFAAHELRKEMEAMILAGDPLVIEMTRIANQAEAMAVAFDNTSRALMALSTSEIIKNENILAGGGKAPPRGGGRRRDPHAGARAAFNEELHQAKLGEAGERFKESGEEAEEAARIKLANQNNKEFDRLAKEEERRLKRVEKTRRQAVAEHKRAEQARIQAERAALQQRIQIANATAQILQGGAQTANLAATEFIKGEKRKERATNLITGTQAIAIGALEAVKAAAAFAGFNYVQGALHTAASVFAIAQGGIYLAKAGGGGGGGRGGGRTMNAPMAGGGPAVGPGTSSQGGRTPSSGGGRPSAGGPLSPTDEESVQRSGRGTRTNGSGGGAGETTVVNIQNYNTLGDVDDKSAIKLQQALDRSKRKAGRVSS